MHRRPDTDARCIERADTTASMDIGTNADGPADMDAEHMHAAMDEDMAIHTHAA
jgi:hypothetical protein